MTERRQNTITAEKLTDAIEAAVKNILPSSIKETVNGKIDDLHKQITSNDEKVNIRLDKIDFDNNDIKSQLLELKPVREGLRTVTSLREFAIWGAVLVTPLYALYQFMTKH